MTAMARFLLICVGGAVGTGARYLFSTAMTRAFGNFPFGTLGVNVIGSFLASVVMVLALEKSALSPDLRLIVVTGGLGGFRLTRASTTRRCTSRSRARRCWRS